MNEMNFTIFNRGLDGKFLGFILKPVALFLSFAGGSCHSISKLKYFSVYAIHWVTPVPHLLNLITDSFPFPNIINIFIKYYYIKFDIIILNY